MHRTRSGPTGWKIAFETPLPDSALDWGTRPMRNSFRLCRHSTSGWFFDDSVQRLFVEQVARQHLWLTSALRRGDVLKQRQWEADDWDQALSELLPSDCSRRHR